MWVLINSTNKVFDGWIRNLGFNLYLHQKSIGVLIWWYLIIKNYYQKWMIFETFSKKKKKKTLVLLRLDQQREQELGLVNILGHQDRKTRHGFCPPSELQTKSSRSPIPSPLPTFSSIYWWSRGFLLSKRKRYRTKLRSTKQNSKGLELKTNPVEGDWSKRP